MLLGRRGLVCWSIKFWLRSACWNNLVCSKAAPIQGCEPYKYIYIYYVRIYIYVYIYILYTYIIHIIYILYTYDLHIIYISYTNYLHIIYIYIIYIYIYYIHIIYILYTYYIHTIHIIYTLYIYILCQILEAPRYFFNHDFINTDGWQCFKSVLIDEFSQDGAGPVGDEWTC